jgi:hypothetical protein
MVVRCLDWIDDGEVRKGRRGSTGLAVGVAVWSVVMVWVLISCFADSVLWAFAGERVEEDDLALG